MGGRGILRAVLLAAALVAGLGAGAAQAQEDHSYYGPRLIEERVRIPTQNGRTIAGTILRPDAQGPFGAVILNHGVSASARERARESSDLLINAAAVFARRGYVVVMPLQRGFGATGGEMAEDPGSCSNPDYRSAESNAAGTDRGARVRGGPRRRPGHQSGRALRDRAGGARVRHDRQDDPRAGA